MKRTSKKIAAFVLVASTLLFTLAGCSGSSNSSDTSGSTANDTAASNASSSNDSGETYEMTICHSYAETTLHGKNLLFLEQQIEELTDGRVEVTIYPNAQICTSADEINTVATNAVNATCTVITTAETVNPMETLLTIPFLVNVEPGDSRLRRAMIEDENVEGIINAEAEKAGFKRLGDLPTSLGGFILANNVKEVTKPSDAKDLKVRTVGGDMGRLLLDQLGVASVSIAAPEVPIGLQQGVFDGLLAVLPNYHDSNWHTKYLSLPYCLAYPCPLYANMDWWNSLPADIQDIIENQAVPATIDNAFTILETYEAEVLEKMQQDPYNVQVTYWDMDDPEIAAWVEETRQTGIDMCIDKFGEPAETYINRVLELKAELGIA